MSDTALLHRLLEHNRWATARLVESCRSLSAEQFTQQFDIGPRSCHDTLLHIVGAMERWADRIGHRALRSSPEETAAESHRTLSVDELATLLDAAHTDLATVAHAVIDSAQTEEPLSITIRGVAEPFVFTHGTAVLHVLTHGMHHRAQVLNMLRQLGQETPAEVDIIEWEIDTRQ